MSFTREIVDHIKRNRGLLKPLILRCAEVGFSCYLVKDGEETDMLPYATASDFTEVYELAASHALPANATLQVRLQGRTLTSSKYDEKGHTNIEMVFLKGSARDFFRGMPKLIAQIRQILFDNFTTQTIFDLIDFGGDYMMKTKHPFSYAIVAFDKPIFKAELQKKVLKASILDPAAYVRLGLFMLKGADAMAMSFRNPFDILALLDTMQSSLRYLALAYDERGMTIEVSALGQKLFSCGYGVKTNLMTDRFGPVSLHLDAIFKILTSTLSGDKEANP